MLQEMVQQEENRRQSGGSSSAVRASIESTLAFLRQELAKTQRLVQQQVEQSAELRSQQQLLCSIPGVGAWTAARVLAEIEVVRATVNARQLAAYAGLTPQERTSGSSVSSACALDSLRLPHRSEPLHRSESRLAGDRRSPLRSGWQ